VEGRGRKQGGEVQCGLGVVLAFYRGRGSTVEVVTHVTARVMALVPLMAGGG
jgi:hypothetical protein